MFVWGVWFLMSVCMSGGLEFQTKLGGQIFYALQVMSVCMCFVSVIFVGGRGDL